MIQKLCFKINWRELFIADKLIFILYFTASISLIQNKASVYSRGYNGKITLMRERIMLNQHNTLFFFSWTIGHEWVKCCFAQSFSTFLRFCSLCGFGTQFKIFFSNNTGYSFLCKYIFTISIYFYSDCDLEYWFVIFSRNLLKESIFLKEITMSVHIIQLIKGISP